MRPFLDPDLPGIALGVKGVRVVDRGVALEHGRDPQALGLELGFAVERLHEAHPHLVIALFEPERSTVQSTSAVVACWLMAAGAARMAHAIFAALDSSACALDRAVIAKIPTSMDMAKIKRICLPLIATPSCTVVLGTPHPTLPRAKDWREKDIF